MSTFLRALYSSSLVCPIPWVRANAFWDANRLTFLQPHEAIPAQTMLYARDWWVQVERQSDPARLDTELHEYGRGCQYHLSRAYPSDVQADPAGGNRRLEIDIVFLFIVSQNPIVTPILAGYHIFQKTCIRFGNQQCDLDVVLLLMLDIFFVQRSSSGMGTRYYWITILFRKISLPASESTKFYKLPLTTCGELLNWSWVEVVPELIISRDITVEKHNYRNSTSLYCLPNLAYHIWHQWTAELQLKNSPHHEI